MTKRWYKSVAVWGGLLSIATALGLAGIQFDPVTGDFSGNIYTLWGSLTAFAGGVMAVIGRFRAVAKIGRRT